MKEYRRLVRQHKVSTSGSSLSRTTIASTQNASLDETHSC